jgi:hypothetical protein
MLLSGRVVVDRRGIYYADDSMVQLDEDERQSERQPVFVETQDDDHDEKVEVGLDVAAGEVHEQRGAREESKGDESRAELSGTRNEESCQRKRGGKQASLQDAVDQGKAHRHGKDRQRERVHGEEGNEEPVALLPVGGWQRVSAR